MEFMKWKRYKAGRNLNIIVSVYQLVCFDFLTYKLFYLLFPLPGDFTHMSPAQLSSSSPYPLNLSLNFASS